MAHMMKHTKASCGHMFAHFDRKAENISNENLDRTRTHLNYNLAVNQQMEQGEFVRQRCSEVYCHNRKDINVMVSWIVTAPKDLPEQEQNLFFKASYEFLQNRYGKDNVVSAYVHMDEVTPHMHFAFVPVVYDQKKCIYKVSAKEAVDRSDLRTFHKDLQKHVERVLGHDVSILNEATKNGNRSIEELKRQSAVERLQKVNSEAFRIVSEAQKQAKRVNDSLVGVKAEYEAKKAYIRHADELSDVSVMYPEEATITEKGLLHKQKYVTVPAGVWEARHVSANEKACLQKATETFEKNIEDFKDNISVEKMDMLARKVKELEKENELLKQFTNTYMDSIENDKMLDMELDMDMEI